MGDIIELLEFISKGTSISDDLKNSNLFEFLTNKEYIEAYTDAEGRDNAVITAKGELYLAALYLLRIEQTPNNFFDRGQVDGTLSWLETDGYLVIEKDEGSKGHPSFTITERGRAAIDGLKEQ